jgi:hypothetical protein
VNKLVFNRAAIELKPGASLGMISSVVAAPLELNAFQVAGRYIQL